MFRIFSLIPLIALLFAGANLLCYSYAQQHDSAFPSSQPPTSTVKVYSYKVINVYPHDRNAFTQGLVFENGALYEGTGLRGKSSLRKVELETGKILQILNLPDQIFGEGIAIYNNKIVQLTWKSGRGFVYDLDSFKLRHDFSYSNEGWGITSDGERLIMSDGTSIIRFLDTETFREVNQIQVYDDRGPVRNLNELEYAKGEIYANVWRSNRIAKIAPDSGKVTGWIDLEGLYLPEGPAKPVDSLNGIAYDSENDRLFVTGKLWPKLFEIKVVDR
jgi:glutamine cyclotransferase